MLRLRVESDRRVEKERDMNAPVKIENNAYERIAVNLAELLDDSGLDCRDSLYRLLSSAYEAAYRKATESSGQ